MYLWLGILIVSLVIEISTALLVSIWFVAGALIALILNLLDFSLAIQILGLVLGSATTFIIIRPRLLKYIRKPKIATNNDKLLGEFGEVVEDIVGLENGKVKIQGQVWTARSVENEDIGLGEVVEIKGIEGVKLLVKKRRD